MVQAPLCLPFFSTQRSTSKYEKELRTLGKWEETKIAVDAWFKARKLTKPRYREDKLPKGHNGTGLLFLGIPSCEIVPRDLYDQITERVLRTVRGTIQADILKEDQAQNTCIFSTEFSLRMMGDCQEYFINHDIKISIA